MRYFKTKGICVISVISCSVERITCGNIKKKTLKDICKYIFITAEIFIKTKFSKSKKIESNSKNCIFMTFSSLKYITVFLLSWRKFSQKEILADEVFSLKAFVPLDC